MRRPKLPCYDESDHEYIEINEEEFSSDSDSESGSLDLETNHHSKGKGKAKANGHAQPKKKIEPRQQRNPVMIEDMDEFSNFSDLNEDQPVAHKRKRSVHPQGSSSQDRESNDSKDRHQRVLKATQLKLEKLIIENKQLRKGLADANVQNSKYNKSDGPGPSSSRKKSKKNTTSDESNPKESRISLHARKFGIMNEIFVAPAYFLVEDPKCNPYSSDRYKNSYSTGQGVIAELFGEVPKDLHKYMMKHTGFRDEFLSALNTNRRNVVFKLRTSIAPAIFKQNTINYRPDTDRSKFPDFVDAVYRPGSKRFSKFAPILFPGGIYDMNKFLKCKHLALMIRGILHGPSSLTSNSKSPSQPTQGILWGVKRVTPGSIAFVATLAIFLHSNDKNLEPVGRVSNIPYKESFNAYKSILIQNSNNKDPLTLELFEFYDKIVFAGINGNKGTTLLEGNEEEGDSSGIEDAIRHIQSLNMHDSDGDQEDSLQSLTPPPDDFMGIPSMEPEREVDFEDESGHCPTEPHTDHAPSQAFDKPEVNQIIEASSPLVHESGMPQPHALEEKEARPEKPAVSRRSQRQKEAVAKVVQFDVVGDESLRSAPKKRGGSRATPPTRGHGKKGI